MTLDFLDDVFLLHLPLETAKGVFDRLALLQLYFCQTKKHLQPTAESPHPHPRDRGCKVQI